MSNSSNSSVIKRFTYDWLIRFAELHPSQPYDNKDGAYNSQNSTYASISPIFTTIITQYMPSLVYCNSVDNKEIQKLLAAPRRRNTIIVVQDCYLDDPTYALITEVEANRVFFHGKVLQIKYKPGPITENTIAPDEFYKFIKFWKFGNYRFKCHTLTPDEFEFLLHSKHCKRIPITINSVLTAPMRFSEVWPQMLHHENITLNIQNINYGDNIVAVLRENRILPKKCGLYGLDISDRAVLLIFKYLLSLNITSKSFGLGFLESKSAMLRGTILNMHERTRPPHCTVHTSAGSFNEVILHFQSDGNLSFHFANKL